MTRPAEFYPGGTSAHLAEECITKVKVIDYPELYMKAVHWIEVKSFPTIIVADKGKIFY